MDLPSKKVYEVLRSKGVDKLYHANSVLTACHFLRSGYLASRGTVEADGIFQTAQYTDALDKRYSVWFDVFTDTVDIHHRARRRNKYGPVLFVLDLEAVSRQLTGRIWVTKKNPANWAGIEATDRWFQSIEELQDSFTKGTFDQMVVFRHCGGRLPIRGCVSEIILDYTTVRYSSPEVGFFPMAYGALTLAMTEGQNEANIVKRKCREGCDCQDEYGANLDRTEQYFAPKLVVVD